MAYLSKRRERMIQLRKATEQQQYRIDASRRGAIAVLAFFGAIGFLSGWLAGWRLGH